MDDAQKRLGERIGAAMPSGKRTRKGSAKITLVVRELRPTKSGRLPAGIICGCQGSNLLEVTLAL